MEAELVRELPEADGWQYEPKWDGFRGLLENTSGELRLWSRNARPLLRYFPELVPLGKLLPPDSALDGEIVIERDGILDFDSMQTRLHPAESRVRKLSAEIPARFIAFDVLVWKGEEIWPLPLSKRRARLQRSAKRFELSPATGDLEQALDWLERFESVGLHRVIAKRPPPPARPATRGSRGAPSLASRTPRTAASPSRTAGAAGSSRRAPCARSWWWRCATTRCRRIASATARSSCASATTRIRSSALGASCSRRARPAIRASTRCSPRRPRSIQARRGGGRPRRARRTTP